jgi:leader peptidase (prepilin peptidase)/N-methyltransferase
MSFLELLQSSPLLFAVMSGVLGLMVGSFLNVVIHRLPKMMEMGWQQQCAELSQRDAGENQSAAETSVAGVKPALHTTYNLIVPRSACPHCNHAISAWENIPVVSYLLLRGKCRGCGAAISPRYPIIEAVSGMLCAYAAWRFGSAGRSRKSPAIWALLALT